MLKNLLKNHVLSDFLRYGIHYAKLVVEFSKIPFIQTKGVTIADILSNTGDQEFIDPFQW